MKDKILEAVQISKTYGEGERAVHALKNSDLTLENGTFASIIGSRGSGKSTLLKILGGHLPPTTGKVQLDGQDIYAMNAEQLAQVRRQKIGFIFQDFRLFPEYTVRDNILIPVYLDHRAPDEQMLHKLTGILGIAGKLHSRPAQLSGGQQQRVGIARALAVNPEFIVCDEPISALDVSIQSQVVNMLVDMQHEMGLTYLFTAHDLSVVRHNSHRIGVMYLGTIVETAPKKELYANPRHPYTRALLSAVPIPDPEVKKERITLKGDLPSPSNPPSGCLFHTRCPHCTEKCKTQVPTPVEIAPGHIVKCHYPELTE